MPGCPVSWPQPAGILTLYQRKVPGLYVKHGAGGNESTCPEPDVQPDLLDRRGTEPKFRSPSVRPGQITPSVSLTLNAREMLCVL